MFKIFFSLRHIGCTCSTVTLRVLAEGSASRMYVLYAFFASWFIVYLFDLMATGKIKQLFCKHDYTCDGMNKYEGGKLSATVFTWHCKKCSKVSYDKFLKNIG